jgi:hypothetical protein
MNEPTQTAVAEREEEIVRTALYIPCRELRDKATMTEEQLVS